MKLLSIITLAVFFTACNFKLSQNEINSRLAEFGLELLENPNVIKNEIAITHLDYYETLALKLSDREFKNIKSQITSSDQFVDLTSYKIGLETFNARAWTFGDIYGNIHLAKDETIEDPRAIEMAYYDKNYKNLWVERIDPCSKEAEYYKYSDGEYGGEVSILKNSQKLFYHLQEE